MKYVCEERDGKYGVKDPATGEVCFYSEDELRQLHSQERIAGVENHRIIVTASIKELTELFNQRKFEEFLNKLTCYHNATIEYEIRSGCFSDGMIWKLGKLANRDEWSYAQRHDHATYDIDHVLIDRYLSKLPQRATIVFDPM